MGVPWVYRTLAIAAFPGLLLTIVFGATPHGGSFGDARDWILIPLGCALFWGSLLFGLALALARWRRKAMSAQ